MQELKTKTSDKAFKIIALQFIAVIILSILIFQALKTRLEQPTGFVTIQTSVNIQNVSRMNCSVTLTQGWNLASLNCLDDPSFEQGFSSILDSYEAVFTYDSLTNSWIAYNPDLPEWVVQSKPSVNKRKAYWIKMKQSDVWNYTGFEPLNIVVELQKGWNLVGYPSVTSKNISQALSNIEYSIVWTHDNANKQMLYYKNSSNNTFTTMQPGQGYWINSSSLQYWSVT